VSVAGLVQIFPRRIDAGCEVYPIARHATLGRAAESDIRVMDPCVSRQHARLSRRGSRLHVEDLGSSHGTFVDGEAVGGGGADLPDGSLLRMGETLLLASRELEPYAQPLRRLSAAFLGLPRDVWGGRAFGEVFAQASRIASLPQPVLILGESGSGKEAVARVIHALRERAGPFVALNVAAIPEPLFEAELFGYVRGAFTGAVQASPGAFREANGGVLFLDEIGDLRNDLQVKLLRALDEMRVRPLGSSESIPVDVRIIAATSRDLVAMRDSKAFRADLYYRLAGAVIEVPPLRERCDEIVALAQVMLARDHSDIALNVEAAEALCTHTWEGNVRELEHTIHRAAVSVRARAGSVLTRADLPQVLQPPLIPELRPSLPAAISREQLCAAMQESGGNALQTAKRLGISRATLYLWFKRHAIDPRALRAG
jgi:DNA-binding NtrC family response regulator